MSLIRRILIRNIKPISHIPTYQYVTTYRKSTKTKQSKKTVKKQKKNTDDTNVNPESQIPMKQSLKKRESTLYEILSKASSPSDAHQDIINALNECTNNGNIMDLLSNSIKDQLVFFKAIEMITKINKISEDTDDAIKHILLICDMMKGISSLDINKYNVLLNSFSTLRGDNECKQTFENMISYIHVS